MTYKPTLTSPWVYSTCCQVTLNTILLDGGFYRHYSSFLLKPGKIPHLLGFTVHTPPQAIDKVHMFLENNGSVLRGTCPLGGKC